MYNYGCSKSLDFTRTQNRWYGYIKLDTVGLGSKPGRRWESLRDSERVHRAVMRWSPSEIGMWKRMGLALLHLDASRRCKRRMASVRRNRQDLLEADNWWLPLQSYSGDDNHLLSLTDLRTISDAADSNRQLDPTRSV